jgi:hypothetical protein
MSLSPSQPIRVLLVDDHTMGAPGIGRLSQGF